MLAQRAADNKLSRRPGGRVGPPLFERVGSDSCFGKNFSTGRRSDMVRDLRRASGHGLRQIQRARRFRSRTFHDEEGMIHGGHGGLIFTHKFFASRASRPTGPGKDSPGRRELFATAALGNSVAGPRPERCGTMARSAGCPALSALRSEARAAQGGGCLRPPSPWAILSRPVGPIGIGSNLWVMASTEDPPSGWNYHPNQTSKTENRPSSLYR